MLLAILACQLGASQAPETLQALWTLGFLEVSSLFGCLRNGGRWDALWQALAPSADRRAGVGPLYEWTIRVVPFTALQSEPRVRQGKGLELEGMHEG